MLKNCGANKKFSDDVTEKHYSLLSKYTQCIFIFLHFICFTQNVRRSLSSPVSCEWVIKKEAKMKSVKKIFHVRHKIIKNEIKNEKRDQKNWKLCWVNKQVDESLSLNIGSYFCQHDEIRSQFHCSNWMFNNLLLWLIKNIFFHCTSFRPWITARGFLVSICNENEWLIHIRKSTYSWLKCLSITSLSDTCRRIKSIRMRLQVSNLFNVLGEFQWHLWYKITH